MPSWRTDGRLCRQTAKNSLYFPPWWSPDRSGAALSSWQATNQNSGFGTDGTLPAFRLFLFLTSPSRSFSAHQVYLSCIHPQTRDGNSTYDVEAKFRVVYVIQNLTNILSMILFPSLNYFTRGFPSNLYTLGMKCKGITLSNGTNEWSVYPASCSSNSLLSLFFVDLMQASVDNAIK